jgi:hypothetical protein
MTDDTTDAKPGWHYTDAARESAPYSLPNIEVFWADDFELSETNESGWYYWFCLPGCMPDSEATGPFATVADALENAREMNGDDE